MPTLPTQAGPSVPCLSPGSVALRQFNAPASRASETRPHLLTVEEVADLLRYGELAALDWQDVDLRVGAIVIRRNVVYGVIQTPKDGEVRHIPMTKRVRVTLAARRPSKGLVFPWRNGRPVRIETATGALHRACSHAGIPRVGWHVLRHTFASHLVMRGVPLKAIQELLGHSDIRMTMRYAHLAPSAIAQAVAALDDASAAEHLGHPVGNAAPLEPSVSHAGIAT